MGASVSLELLESTNLVQYLDYSRRKWVEDKWREIYNLVTNDLEESERIVGEVERELQHHALLLLGAQDWQALEKQMCEDEEQQLYTHFFIYSAEAHRLFAKKTSPVPSLTCLWRGTIEIFLTSFLFEKEIFQSNILMLQIKFTAISRKWVTAEFTYCKV